MLTCPACRTSVADELLAGEGRTCPHCGEDLKETAVAGLNSPTGNATSTRLMPAPRIRGVTILRQIGEGGMGCVWEAEQTSLGRRVAVKALAPHLASNPHFMSRFRQEAKALARLSHPGIVSVYDLVEERNECCIIMEYIEGPGGEPIDVKSLMHSAGLQVIQVRQLITQVLRALQVAHERGIIHRDVKPSNIMVDSAFNAKVVDFGIAALQETSDDHRLTVAGGAMGTLDYMAPEQLTDAKSVDARADIYSAGVVLYEMLTGRLPRGAFPPPSQVVEGLATGWDTVILKALAPERKDRFASAAEMADAIETIPIGDPQATVHPAAPRKPKSSVSIPDRACSQCHTPVASDDQFCPSCGKALLRHCPSCRTALDAGAKFCKSCGVDVHKWEKYQEHFAAGQEALQQARISTTPVEERFEYAERAALHLTKALKARPDEQEGRQLLSMAVKVATQCGLQAGQAAIDRKEISAALEFFEAVQEINPDDQQARAQLQRLLQQRDKLADKAEELLRQGQPQKAAAGLEKALDMFPKDERLAELLHRSQTTKVVLSDLADRVRVLETDKKLHELDDLLQQTRKHHGGLPVALADYANQLGVQLHQVQLSLKNAQTQFNQGDYVAAKATVAKVRDFVVDNANANQLWDMICQEERRARRIRIFWQCVATLLLGGTLTLGGLHIFKYLEDQKLLANSSGSDERDNSSLSPTGHSQQASSVTEEDPSTDSDKQVSSTDPPSQSASNPGEALADSGGSSTLPHQEPSQVADSNPSGSGGENPRMLVDSSQVEQHPEEFSVERMQRAVSEGLEESNPMAAGTSLNGWISKNYRW